MKIKTPGYLFRYLFLFIVVFLLLAGCQRRKKSEVLWDKSFPRIGSQSSPRATDLNGDGVKDIVMGAGQNEYQHSDQGVLALDGKTGDVLWQAEAEDQVYGSATFYDVNDDGVDDVFIGGRSPNFRALDGKTGKVLWSYTYQYENHPVLQHVRFNFNNSVLVPDQNGDGLQDLLTVNGGNSKADPYTEVNRFPAVLLLFDSKSGNIIAADTMPDGRESYMSPVCFLQRGAKDHTIVFGTGGETLPGNLYEVSLSDLAKGDVSDATILASEQGHGFIAPPTIADITDDGFYDVVAISHGSTVFAIDGKSRKVLWRQTIPETESSNSLAAGYFTEDDIPDFFTFVSKGEWPNSTGSLQILLDGSNGRISFLDSIGCTGFSSPVVYDLNNDGRDEAIISINEYDCATGFTGNSPREIENKLLVIDFVSNTIRPIDQQKGFKNIFSTPYIGDLDGDGYLDIVHGQYFHRFDLLNFMGMRLKRIATPIRMRKAVLWGSYMGSAGDGIFR